MPATAIAHRRSPKRNGSSSTRWSPTPDAWSRSARSVASSVPAACSPSKSRLHDRRREGRQEAQGRPRRVPRREGGHHPDPVDEGVVQAEALSNLALLRQLISSSRRRRRAHYHAVGHHLHDPRSGREDRHRAVHRGARRLMIRVVGRQFARAAGPLRGGFHGGCVRSYLDAPAIVAAIAERRGCPVGHRKPIALLERSRIRPRNPQGPRLANGLPIPSRKQACTGHLVPAETRRPFAHPRSNPSVSPWGS